jgi:hypothetical protein
MLAAPSRSTSASVAHLSPVTPSTAPARPWQHSTWLAILTALSVATFCIHGYHPLADDGGLYAAGIELKLNPSLFPNHTAFVTEHLSFSLFAPTIAALTRLSHLPLAWTLLLVDLVSIFFTLYAALCILRRCVPNQGAQLAGICLFSAFWTLPIAGTSLFMMDPYLTARSLSTPLALLAIAFALDPWPTQASRKPPSPASLLCCLACLLLAALVHPLMAAYACGFIVILRLTRLPLRRLPLALFVATAILLAAALQALAPHESPALIAAEQSRAYWFLSQWRWFELFGLIGPLAVLAAVLARSRSLAANLCRAAIATGLIATLIAFLFAHRDAPTHLVARLQPLRSFLFVYEIMTLLLGATLMQLALDARRSLNSRPLRFVLAAVPVVTLAALASILFSVQRLTFPASPHMELPWQAARSSNPWVRAFLWARDNTPTDALFALDANYINDPGEDAQTFRATALRSALPDASKDGGEAAITPSLATLWQSGSAAQANLSAEPDALRDARLQPFSVTWMVLHSNARTLHPCPYDNGAIKVCRLDPPSSSAK